MLLETYNLYPEIAPFQTGLLSVSDTHQIYYEQCGNPEGHPIVFLHGGPGSGCNAAQRRFFDPKFYRVILFDQRGCGRSRPLASTKNNTTADLVEDIHLLKAHLNIEQWLVFGGSWGSTLALAYALTYTSDISGLILRGIFLSRTQELSWFLGESALFYPEAWNKLTDYLPADERGNVLSAYEKRIFSDDIKISAPAACAWNAYESSIMSLIPDNGNGKPIPDDIQVARARVQIHYIANHCFVAQYDFLNNVSKLSHIPTTIVQGRYDMVCPPLTAWELKQAMPHAELKIIADAGHSGMETGTISALVAATEQFKLLSR